MALDSMVVILLPIILFLISLIITFVLRESDNRKRGLTNVRRLTDQYKNEIEAQSSDFKAWIEELDSKIAKKDTQLKELIQDADTKIDTIKNYTDDMANLRKSMETYKDALSGLAKLTNEADAKVSQIDSDVLRLEEVHNMIDTFRIDMKDADEHLKQHESTVIQLQRDTVTHLEETISSFRTEADKALEETRITVMQYHSALEAKIESTKEAVSALNAMSLKYMDDVGNRLSDQQVLASQIEELTKTRDQLSSSLGILEQQVEEKKNFASELEQITREENERLTMLKRTINEARESLREQTQKEELKLDATKPEAVEPVVEENNGQQFSEEQYIADPFNEDPFNNMQFGEASFNDNPINEEPVTETSLTEEPVQDDSLVEEQPEEKEEAIKEADTGDVLENESEEVTSDEEVIIEEASKEKVEYYGQEEEIVF